MQNQRRNPNFRPDRITDVSSAEEEGDTCGILICAEYVSERWPTKALSRELKNQVGKNMNTDPIADMINRIKTAQAVSKKTIKVPFSNLKFEIAKILEAKGWIGKVEKKGKKTGKILEIELKYHEDGDSFIADINKISTPGQRIYTSVNRIKKVRDGAGMSIISTSKGLMTNYEARKAKLGGEILIEVY